jgi:hypothetical protein
VVQFVEALRYKPEGLVFDSRCHYGPGVVSASNRNQYQEYVLGPVLGADNLTNVMCRMSEILGALTSWNPQGLPRSVQGLLYFYSYTC